MKRASDGDSHDDALALEPSRLGRLGRYGENGGPHHVPISRRRRKIERLNLFRLKAGR
jgi:hypothetical protein